MTSRDFMLDELLPAVEILSAADDYGGKHFAVMPPVQDSRLVSVVPPRQSGAGAAALRLPAGFEISPEAVLNERGLPDRIRSLGDQAEMALIEGGLFTLGFREGPANARPECQAIVDPFYMDVTEVTLAQYQRFEQALRDPANRRPASQGLPQPARNSGAAGDVPAVGIAFRDAEDYARFYRKSLPTEAEWELAARGPRGNRYPWGQGRPLTHSPATELAAVGSNPLDRTPAGIYDLAGNAREWTTDWYGATIFQEYAATKTSIRQPTGPRRGDALGERTVRGSRQDWNLWHRAPANVRDSSDDIGFRCILRVTPELLSR